ncbi:DUF6349 family protein [Lutimaribacter marinistellae]|uniref:DUF6349 family protein n=1 Tax=Lutimaribacter marinistellae TaxID=1820329 RepID=A0ABV7TD98_9RHOB
MQFPSGSKRPRASARLTTIRVACSACQWSGTPRAESMAKMQACSDHGARGWSVMPRENRPFGAGRAT